MTDIQPRFFDHPDFCIRFMEWQAIEYIFFNRDYNKHYEYFDAYSQNWHFWSDYYQEHGKESHKQIMGLIVDGTYKSMDDFYNAINKLLKPRKLGKALKDAKMRTAQAAFQLEKYGEDSNQSGYFNLSGITSASLSFKVALVKAKMEK